MKSSKIILTLLQALLIAGCSKSDPAEEEYVITKSIDFEHHMFEKTMVDYLRTRTEYPYINDKGVLLYNDAFYLPLDGSAGYYHPAAPADVSLCDVLLDLDDIRIADMDYANITCASISTDPIIAFLDKDDMVKYAKATNDSIAAAIKRHPDRYIGAITLPLPYIEESLKELDRAVNQLGLKYLHTWSNYKDRHIYEDEFEPVIAKCAELGIPIYLHPGVPEDEYLTDSGPIMASAGFGFTVDSMKSMLRLIIGGVFDKYPDLKIIMGHMAEFFPYCLERLDNRFEVGREFDPYIKCEKTFKEYFDAKNIFMSTSGIGEPEVIYFVINTIGPDNIIFGTDYPMEDYKAATDFIKNLSVSKEIKDKIFYKNAETYILK